jgi:hypothetical protein
MLSDLAGSFSMENMGGAGMAYTQNIRDYAAPELDANSEESLRARQRWAQNNGYQDEANSLGVKLGELGAANQLKAETDDKNARMANMFGNAIPGLPENLQDVARGMRDGIAAGEIPYLDAVKFLQNPQGGSDAPAAVREYQFFKNLDPAAQAEYQNLKRSGNIIDLGGGGIGYRGPDGTVQVLVSPEDATARDGTAALVSSEGTSLGTQNVTDSTEALKGYAQLRDTNNLYQQAWTLLDEGKANTGTIDSMLPTIKDASIELQTLGNELGFQIVAGGKFGQLTENELKLALTTGLPKNMSEEGLKQWLVDKMEANNKLKAEYNKFLTWSQSTDSANKTAAYYQFNEMQDPASAEAPAVPDDSGVVSDAEAAAKQAKEDEEFDYDFSVQ